MFHSRIIKHYAYLVIECQCNAVDACTDVAQYEGIGVHTLATFLRAIEAPYAHRLSVI